MPRFLLSVLLLSLCAAPSAAADPATRGLNGHKAVRPTPRQCTVASLSSAIEARDRTTIRQVVEYLTTPAPQVVTFLARQSELRVRERQTGVQDDDFLPVLVQPMQIPANRPAEEPLDCDPG